MPVSKKDFLIAASQSQVVPESKLKRWANDGSVTDGLELANHFVRLGILTEWQAKYLLTGRSQLIVGNYVLLQRLRRDEWGDHFQAQHHQLNRMVEILFLAAVLSQDDELSTKFVRRVGETAELDHPHLAHVYDVDRQSARYYLVTEFVDGMPLNDWLDREPCSCGQLAGWLRQALTGIRYAHLNNVLIGNFQASDLMITPNSELKLQNIVVAGLREEGGFKTVAGSEKSDLLKLAEVFQSAMQQRIANDPKFNNSAFEAHQANTQLKQAIDIFSGQINQFDEDTRNLELSECQAVIDELLNACILVETGSNEDQESGRRPGSGIASEAAGKQSLKTDGRLAYNPSGLRRSTQTGDPALDPNFDPPTFSDRIFQRPSVVLTGAFFSGLILATLGSWWWMISGSSPGLVDNVSQGIGTQQTSLKEADFATKERQSGPGKLVSEIADQLEMREQEAFSGNGTADQTSEHAALDDPTQMGGDDHSKKDLGMVSDSDTNVSGVANQDINSFPRQTETSAAILGSELAETNHTKSSSDHESTEANVEANVEANSTSQPSVSDREAKEQQPFQKLAAASGLPPIGDTIQVKLGDLYISNRYLLGLELSIAEGMSPDRVNFEMERSVDDNQTWLAYLVTGSAGRRNAIAEFQRREDELLFRWLPEAAGTRQAGFLQNGVLRCFTPEHNHLMFLRLPVPIEPLILEDGKLTAETNIELDFLPDQRLLLIELLRPEIEEISVSPNLIDLEMNLPGRVLLKKEDNSPYMWVNLGIEFKQRAKLRADLVISDGLQVIPLKNLKEFNRITLASKQQELILQQQLQVSEATQAPYGKADEKRRFEAELRKTVTAARTAATKYAEYSGLVQKMMGVPYGVRIVARVDGREFEIAKTRLVEVKPESSEPEM